MNHLVEEAAFTAHKLAILQAYPLGTLEVEYPLAGNPYGDTMRRRLNGLNAETGIATLSNETTIWCAHCQPILRPFSSLCTPLEDGTVPAVKLARMIFDDMVGDGDEVHAGFDHFGNVVVAAGAVRVMSITPDWLFYPEDGNHAGPPEYRKLLEWHFALPVNGRTLIEGRDYLPK